MRATLVPDPHRGPEYALLELHDTVPAARRVFRLRRASDGAWLSGAGWRQAEATLRPDAWENDGDCQRLVLGPGIADRLVPGDSYTLTVPGAGSCVVTVDARVRSGGIAEKEGEMMPPPPEPRRKRLGCALFGALLFAAWLAGGFALWHGSMSVPATPAPGAGSGDTSEEESSFSLFPRTDPDGEPTYEQEETPKP